MMETDKKEMEYKSISSPNGNGAEEYGTYEIRLPKHYIEKIKALCIISDRPVDIDFFIENAVRIDLEMYQAAICLGDKDDDNNE